MFESAREIRGAVSEAGQALTGPETDQPARPFEEYERVLADAERLLDDVDLALERIRDGSYRSCEVCGGPIAAVSLESAPTVRTCAEHGGPSEA